MRDFQDWRELLGAIIGELDEQQRLAQDLHITSDLLTGWAQVHAMPQTHDFQHLLQAVPDYRQRLLQLFSDELEYTAPTEPANQDKAMEIPSVFYAHVLSICASLSPQIRFWSLTYMILQQALAQLDPRRHGLVMQIIRCMPPASDGKIHSLRTSIGLGTSPWDRHLEDQPCLLGSESLAAQALVSHHSVILDTSPDLHTAALHQEAASIAVYPLERAHRSAGCLLVSSTQSGYFSPQRQALIRHYADLLPLAFEQDEFYSLEQFHLQRMPPLEVQVQHLASFHRRLANLLTASMQSACPIDSIQAELQVWQQFEAEFLSTM